MNKKILIEEEMRKRDEIIKTFHKNYLLEAGAGAGKTTIIVQRIINHILSSDIDPANLVAITFTKAAATELAERIQLKALEYLKNETDPNIIKRLNAVDKIFTGTIHSFCELILKEMPFDANITPSYEIIEDDVEFHNHIWYGFLRDEEQQYRNMTELLKKVGVDYKELRTKALIVLENPDINFIGYDERCDLDHIEGTFEDIRKEFKGLRTEVFKNNSNMAKLFRSLLEEEENFKSYSNSILKEFCKEELIVDLLYEKIIAKKYWGSEDESRYKDFIEGMCSLYNKLNIVIYNACTDFIQMVVAYKKKRYHSKLTFNELLYRASKLIKESPGAREHFRNKYKYFYIDEFQDTDPMQAELILRLTGDSNGNQHWQDCNPTPGSLFVVGDPKQSIYRFRRADITIYNQVKEIISANGEVVHLDINFRSTDGICNWIENTFRYDGGFGFKEDATMMQAGFKGILGLWDQVIEGERDLISGIYQYMSPEKEDYGYVADIVENILDNYNLVEKKKENDGYHNSSRPIKEGDIMILTKANEETGYYLRELKSRGIPAVLSGEKNLGDNREVYNLFILIDALVDYMDDIKMVSALRNSFYLDLETIELFMENNNSLSQFIFFRDKIEKIDHPSIKRALIYMNEIANLSRELSPIAFIERVIENEVGVYQIDKEYQPLELRDALSSLRQSVEILKAKNCGSLYELREELQKLLFIKVSYELPINKQESENAVRIMNIHKAKGLEANIVILVGGDKKRSVRPSSYYVEKDVENGTLGFIAYGGKHNILGPKEIERKEREKAYKEAEVDRLLYVAATRAKSSLIIANGSDDKSFLYPLSKKVEEVIKPIENPMVKEEKAMELTRGKKRELEITKNLRINKEISTPSYFKIVPSQFEGLRNPTESEGVEVNKGFAYLSPKVKSNNIAKPGVLNPRGKVYGSIVHRAIEILVRRSKGLKDIYEGMIDYAVKTAIKENIEQLEINKTNIGLLFPFMNHKVNEIIEISLEKGSMEAKEIIKSRLCSYTKQTLYNFINNEDIIGLFKNAKNIFPELSFTIGITEKNQSVLDKITRFLSKGDRRLINEKNKNILINGTMDLVIETMDGDWVILDYKTDVYHHKDMVERLRRGYLPQLEGYKILLEEILKDHKVKVGDLLFYSTFNDKVIHGYHRALI